MDAPEKMSSAELTQFVAAVVAETLAARPSPASIAAATLRRFAPSGCAGLVTVLAIAFPDLHRDRGEPPPNGLPGLSGGHPHAPRTIAGEEVSLPGVSTHSPGGVDATTGELVGEDGTYVWTTDEPETGGHHA